MLARQLCLRQARSANVGRPVYPACITPSSRFRRCFQTARRPARGPPNRTTIGTATVVNVDSIPTILRAKDNLEGLTQGVVRNLENEYKNYLQNPWKLSEAIKSRLQKDRYEEALVLSRRASKDGQVPVCWNILIGYLFEKQRLHAAIKLFNEMKKRGQLPTAQTFTVIFRGCANSKHPKTAVPEAMKIYMTMLTSTRLRPNIIHTNAVINTCARALDLEAMMSVAETIDDRERKADATTYSTLLHGLRAAIDAEAAKLPHSQRNGYTPEAHAETVAKVLEQARRIWEEVIRKWLAGALVLDEKLVCAMGRLLLLGNNSDKMSILDLLEQTMWIPNLNKTTPQIGATQNTKGEEGVVAPEQAPRAKHNKPPALTPVPTSMTLSLILMALQDTRRVNLTLGYWRKLTQDHKVIPDANNWNTLLYSLRRGHSSRETAVALRSMPPSFMSDKTFLRALQTCVGDNMNPQVMQNANDILDRMVRVLPLPSLGALRFYADLAMTAHYQFRIEKKVHADQAKLNASLGKQISAALENLWRDDLIPACRSHLIELLKAAGPGGGEPRTRTQRGRGAPARVRDDGPGEKTRIEQDTRGEAKNYASEFITLMRKVVAAWDRVITDGVLPEDQLAPLRPKRNAVNRFVASYFSVLQEEGVLPATPLPSLRRDGGEKSKGGEREGRGDGEEALKETPKGAQGARESKQRDEGLIRRLLEITEDFAAQMPR